MVNTLVINKTFLSRIRFFVVVVVAVDIFSLVWLGLALGLSLASR